MGFPPTIFIILKQSRRFLFRGRNLISITLRKPIIIYCGTGLPTKDDRAELIQFFSIHSHLRKSGIGNALTKELSLWNKLKFSYPYLHPYGVNL